MLSSSADRRRCHWPARGRRDDLAFPRVISCSQLNCFVCCLARPLLSCRALSLPYRLLVTGSRSVVPLGPWSIKVRTDMTSALFACRKYADLVVLKGPQGITCHARVRLSSRSSRMLLRLGVCQCARLRKLMGVDHVSGTSLVSSGARQLACRTCSSYVNQNSRVRALRCKQAIDQPVHALLHNLSLCTLVQSLQMEASSILFITPFLPIVRVNHFSLSSVSFQPSPAFGRE